MDRGRDPPQGVPGGAPSFFIRISVVSSIGKNRKATQCVAFLFCIALLLPDLIVPGKIECKAYIALGNHQG